MALPDSIAVREGDEERERFCSASCQAYIAAYSAMLGDPMQVGGLVCVFCVCVLVCMRKCVYVYACINLCVSV